MPQTLEIGRLTLRFAGQAPGDGERLARLVADRLAEASTESEVWRPMEAVRVSHTGKPGESDEVLARELAAAILRELERLI
jgi:hypothetical protein